MKKLIQTLVAIAAFGGLAFTAQAQPAVKILVVDMAKLYDNHYKTLDYNAKLQAADEQAKDEIAKMNKEGQAIVDEYKALDEQAKNPALSADAKAKAQTDAQKKYEEIQKKQNEVQTFIQQTQQSLRQRLQTFRSVMLEEISNKASEIAKRHGATLLLDKSGPSLIGVSPIVYADPAYDITDEVLKELNKDKPATPATTTPAASSSSTTPTPSSTPAAAPTQSSGGITVPGIKK